MPDELYNNTKELENISDKIFKKYFEHNYSFTNDDNFQIFTTLRYDPLTYNNDGNINLLEAINSNQLDKSFFFQLEGHVDKLRRSGEFFGFPTKNLSSDILLFHLTKALNSIDKLIAHRIKISVDKKGNYSIDYAPLPHTHILSTKVPNYDEFQKIPENSKFLIPRYLQDWKGWLIYLDKIQSQPTPFTSFKTTKREVYNNARLRFNIIPGDNREVLLQDNNNNILEGSITSVAFWRQVKNPLTNEISFKWVTPNLASGCMDGVIRKWLIDSGSIIEGIIPVSELQDGEYVLLLNGLMGVKVAKLIL